MPLCEFCKHRRPVDGGDGDCPRPNNGGYIPGKESGYTYCPDGFERDGKARKLRSPKKERRKAASKKRKQLPGWLLELEKQGRVEFKC